MERRIQNGVRQRWLTQTVSIHFLLIMISVAEQQGLPRQVLLQKAAISLAEIEGSKTATLGQIVALCRVLDETFGSRLLGMEIGWQLPPTAYGGLGYALMCSATLDVCVELLQRYWLTVNPSVSYIQLQRGSTHYELKLRTHPMLAEPARRIWVESSLASWKRCLDILLNQQAPSVLEFDYPAPSAVFPPDPRYGEVHYGCSASLLRVPAALMQEPLPMANPIQQQVAIQLCEQEMAMLGAAKGEVLSQVRQLMVLGSDGYPTQEQLADRLAMTPRTLRRQLMREGGGYRELREQACREDARRLLLNPQLSVQDIAALLGYANPANFARMFRCWTGQTPSQFRHSSTADSN